MPWVTLANLAERSVLLLRGENDHLVQFIEHQMLIGEFEAAGASLCLCLSLFNP